MSTNLTLTEVQNLLEEENKVLESKEYLLPKRKPKKQISREIWQKLDLNLQTYIIYVRLADMDRYMEMMGNYMKANSIDYSRIAKRDGGGGRTNLPDITQWRPPLPPQGMLDVNDPKRIDVLPVRKWSNSEYHPEYEQ